MRFPHGPTAHPESIALARASRRSRWLWAWQVEFALPIQADDIGSGWSTRPTRHGQDAEWTPLLTDSYQSDSLCSARLPHPHDCRQLRNLANGHPKRTGPPGVFSDVHCKRHASGRHNRLFLVLRGFTPFPSFLPKSEASEQMAHGAGARCRWRRTACPRSAFPPHHGSSTTSGCYSTQALDVSLALAG